MIGPGRVADPDRLARCRDPDQVERLPQRPCAPRRRRRRHPVARHAVAQDHVRHRRMEIRLARKTGIGLRDLGFPQPLFRRLHRPHHRRQARRVLVDAHAQVDLVAARVGPEHPHQFQDRVRRLRFQRGQHGLVLSGHRADLRGASSGAHLGQLLRLARRCATAASGIPALILPGFPSVNPSAAAFTAVRGP